jgi:hypothetical protein
MHIEPRATLVAVQNIDGTPTAFWSDGSIYIQDRATNAWHFDSKMPSPSQVYEGMTAEQLRKHGIVAVDEVVPGYFSPRT